MSNSCRTSNAVTGISEKKYSVAWKKGRESESILSRNAGMAAAVLSPGGVSINKIKKKVVDINPFHFSLCNKHVIWENYFTPPNQCRTRATPMCGINKGDPMADTK